jgi:beta-lactamase class A
MTRRLALRHAAACCVLIAASCSAAALARPASLARKGKPRTCLTPGVEQPLDEVWRPDMAAAARYARSRAGDIAFAVRTDHRFYSYRPNHVEWSASVVKAMLLVAYLDQGSVARRNLNGYDRGLLDPMITQSDNNAAQQVFNTVGQGGLQALAHRVRMTHFGTDPVWGKTRITAADQTRFFLHIDSYVARKHRDYAMQLLASVVPSQRWGVGEVGPKRWKLYFKGGWGYGTGLLDHQVALLVRGCARVSIAVLTMYDGSHGYGKATLRAIFAKLLRHFPTQRLAWRLRLPHRRHHPPVDTRV